MFLGKKEEVKFAIPEIIYNPSLALSPHVILLGLLFADWVFTHLDSKRVFTSAEQLLYLNILDDVYKLLLHLDPALKDVSIFQKSVWTMDKIKISDIEALIYSTIQPWIKCIRALSTFHEILQAYNLDYGAGKALNNSKQISKTVWSLIYQYSNSINQLPEIQEFIQKQNKLTKLLGRSIERHTETVKYKLYKQIITNWQVSSKSLQDEMLQETKDIHAVAAYCLFKKGDTCQLLYFKRPTPAAVLAEGAS
ncbi:conserved hypothetical protein [Coccidioides posadasii str. Silveira]|uniref:Uncharacterized protein n=2 Tax=Coccidioides posadasii TaxID=199306 RepID=E9D8D1_COCPS|nr:conserved hypothetical protein [Coccidioides posadasii str. Silveira]KMM70715.1 hypothetical protein CPAG_07026 [Coccidioides posadasii RMSCC 3488]